MHGHDSTWQRIRAEVSAARKRVGEQVLAGLILVAASSTLSAWMASTAAKLDHATRMAKLEMQVRALDAEVNRIRDDLYRVRTK